MQKLKDNEALALFLVVKNTFLDDIDNFIRTREAWNSLRHKVWSVTYIAV